MGKGKRSAGVTKRYKPSVTKRFEPKSARTQDDSVTKRFVAPDAGEEPASPAKGLPAGTLVADSYRVVEGPLGAITGEAEVYLCDDGRGGAVVLKLYHYDLNPKEAVIAQLEGLVHPNTVRLITHGLWAGRFYEVMEYCAGGVLAEIMPIGEERLIAYLPALLSGLDFCHRQGIVHRDLKPNNLFFRDLEQTQPLLGDFGISSYLDRDEDAVRVTQSASHLTLDYAAPELLDGHEVSAKTDYYALGITLVHLLSGVSPFHGLSHNDVLVAHLRGRLTIPPSVSERFAHLLKGLTLGNPEARWGFEQVTAWLQGQVLHIDERHVAWSSAAAQGQPYPGYPQASTPQQLAVVLEHFDAAQQLLRGDIRRWLFDHFDEEMAGRVEHLEQKHTEKPEIGVKLLRFVLYPKAPLPLGAHQVSGVGELNDLLTEGDECAKELVQRAFWDGEIEAWLESGQLAGDRTGELLTKLAGIRARLQGDIWKGAELRALSFTLDPSQPLQLAPAILAANTREVGVAFQRSRKKIKAALQELLFSKVLEEWIQAAEFPGWEAHLEFIEKTRFLYLNDQPLGTFCLCWHFKPDMPFPFKGRKVTEPAQLAALIEESPENRQLGLKLIEKGWIRAWLVGSAKVADPTTLDHALLALDATTEAKLEAVLQMLDPGLGRPLLTVDAKTLNLGIIDIDQVRERDITVRNTGRGYLSGEVKLTEYGQGVQLDDYRVEGNLVTLKVMVKPLSLSPGAYQNTLHVQTNGGEEAVSVNFIVKEPEDPRAWWQKLLD